MSTTLSYEIVEASGSKATLGAFLVHGILGQGANLRSFAQKLVEAFPSWKILLPDLRAHGDSPAGGPPFDLARCASDLHELTQEIGWKPKMICGHSFGGKVVLSYAQLMASTELAQVWLLDSPPGPVSQKDRDERGISAFDVMVALKKTKLPFQNRKDMIEQLLALGMPRSIALWMTTNLKNTPEGYLWKFNLDAIELMLSSYLAADFWPFLQNLPKHLKVDQIRAEKSTSWSQNEMDRFRDTPQIGFHYLENAGHWVHADNPQGLFDLMAPSFKI